MHMHNENEFFYFFALATDSKIFYPFLLQMRVKNYAHVSAPPPPRLGGKGEVKVYQEA